MKDNKPIIDRAKCQDCGMCADRCPTGSITFDGAKQKIAFVEEEKCIGCTKCAQVCQFDAVVGELKAVHKILADKCVGCRACYDVCPKSAIHMIGK